MHIEKVVTGGTPSSSVGDCELPKGVVLKLASQSKDRINSYQTCAVSCHDYHLCAVSSCALLWAWSWQWTFFILMPKGNCFKEIEAEPSEKIKVWL